MDDFRELRDIEAFCVGTVGPPGQRIFFLQATTGDEVVSWKAEKEHVVVLASTLADVLSEYGITAEPAQVTQLVEPVEPAFAVRQVGLRLMLDDDPETSRVVVVLRDSDEPISETADDYDPDNETGAAAVVWLNANQAAAFVTNAADVVRDGRELAQSNGHRPGLP